jgi:tRNA threonylcarbamoyl adenosine modification protein YeaZ
VTGAADGVTTLAVSGSNVSGDVPFSAALRLADGAVDVRRTPAGGRGDLARLCAELCRDRGVRPQDLGRVLVDVGPGSYTGLRVAVTFVRFLQAFGPAAGKPEVGRVDSLATMALLAADRGRTGRVRALLDARRGRLHTALYDLDGARLVEVEAAVAVATAAVLAAIAPGETIVLPAPLAGQLQALGDHHELLVARDVTADWLFRAPFTRAAAADLEPRYLMASYADE